MIERVGSQASERRTERSGGRNPLGLRSGRSRKSRSLRRAGRVLPPNPTRPARSHYWLVPVVLLVVAIYPQILFQRLVHPFRLTIRLRVICRRPIPLDVQPFEKVSREMGDELRAPIGDSVDRETVELPKMPAV